MRIKCQHIDDCIGKTIAGIGDCHYGTMLLRFTDGTCYAMRADEIYDGSIEFDWQSEIDTESSWWMDAAHEAGLITREQWLSATNCKQQREIQALDERRKSLEADIQRRSILK